MSTYAIIGITAAVIVILLLAIAVWTFIIFLKDISPAAAKLFRQILFPRN